VFLDVMGHTAQDIAHGGAHALTTSEAPAP
jgi:hypothetical protein